MFNMFRPCLLTIYGPYLWHSSSWQIWCKSCIESRIVYIVVCFHQFCIVVLWALRLSNWKRTKTWNEVFYVQIRMRSFRVGSRILMKTLQSWGRSRWQRKESSQMPSQKFSFCWKDTAKTVHCRENCKQRWRYVSLWREKLCPQDLQDRYTSKFITGFLLWSGCYNPMFVWQSMISWCYPKA